MTLPLVYGLSYAIMRGIDVWYEAKSRNTILTVGGVRYLWKSARSDDPAKKQVQVRQTGFGESSC